MNHKFVDTRKEYMRKNFIRCIMDGKVEISNAEAAARIKELSLDWLIPPFLVVNIAPDYSEIKYHVKDGLLNELEEQVGKWLIKKKISHYCITNSYNNIGILIAGFDKEMDTRKIDEIFIEIHQKLQKNYQLGSFIGIGSVVNSYQKISASAMDAHEMLGYKYQYANQGVINIANLTRFQCNTSLANRIAFDRVIGCFQDGNLGKMAVRLDELVEQVRHRPNVSKTSIKRTMIELIVHILHVASNANIDVDGVLGDVEPYRWIMKQNHTEIITEWILQISSQLLANINEKKEFGEKATIQQAKNYIEEHLPDSELGLQQVSEKIGLSSPYFSQLFKREAGIGVNTYIVQSRIARAQLLLQDTDLKCSEIALQTGFSSSGYFVQVFKKNVGMTPGQYRKEHKT